MNKAISILVIEDNEDLSQLLEFDTETDEFNVHVAKDGPSALNWAKEKDTDIILLDWQSPFTNGAKVLNELKADQKTSKIPVFVLNSHMPADAIKQAIEMGADGFIPKTCETNNLDEAIRQRINKNLAEISNDK